MTTIVMNMAKLNRGDRVLLTTASVLHQDEAEDISNYLGGRFPGVEFTIISDINFAANLTDPNTIEVEWVDESEHTD